MIPQKTQNGQGPRTGRPAATPEGAERSQADPRAGAAPLTGLRPPIQLHGWSEPLEESALRRHRPAIIGSVVGLLVLLAGLGYAFLSPATYTATGVVALSPRDPSTTTADTVQMIGRSYTAYLASPEVLGRVAAASGTPATAMTDGTQISVEPSSANVTTSVTLADPGRAAAAANALTTEAAAKATADKLVAPDVVSTATVDSAVGHPPRLVLAAASVLAALLAGLLIAYVLTARARLAGQPTRW